MEEDKCVFCHIICSEEMARQGKCVVIGDKKVCGKCAGHVKVAVENTSVN